jgi:hypothetical protein
MKNSPRTVRVLAGFLGWVALASVVLLFAWDLFPAAFPAHAHDLFGALPLALIAFTYLAYQAVRRPRAGELFKAILLATAFLLWAANQFWPDRPSATLLNDLAIGLFVLDVFLVVIGWPATSAAEDRGL